jgi:hypothetical protein
MTEQELIDNIHAGLYDSHLTAIQSATNSRLAAARGTRTLASFGVGDIVEFNNLCSTRYLIGERAQVVGKRRTKIVVKLENPTGRFVRHTADGPVSADITVPMTIVDLVDLNR